MDRWIYTPKYNIKYIFSYVINKLNIYIKKYILDLMKTYKNEFFTTFNTYITKKFNGKEYTPEAINKIREMLLYNIDSTSDTEPNIINFFDNNSSCIRG